MFQPPEDDGKSLMVKLRDKDLSTFKNTFALCDYSEIHFAKRYNYEHNYSMAVEFIQIPCLINGIDSIQIDLTKEESIVINEVHKGKSIKAVEVNQSGDYIDFGDECGLLATLIDDDTLDNFGNILLSNSDLIIGKFAKIINYLQTCEIIPKIEVVSNSGSDVLISSGSPLHNPRILWMMEEVLRVLDCSNNLSIELDEDRRSFFINKGGGWKIYRDDAFSSLGSGATQTLSYMPKILDNMMKGYISVIDSVSWFSALHPIVIPKIIECMLRFSKYKKKYPKIITYFPIHQIEHLKGINYGCTQLYRQMYI